MKRVYAKQAASHVGQQIKLQGHLKTIRQLGNIAFLSLRDCTGTVQIVVETPELLLAVRQLAVESPISVIGKVISRTVKAKSAAVQPNMMVELQAIAIAMLSNGLSPLPVEVSKNSIVESLAITTLLDYRPLTLRNQKVSAIFKLEAALCRGFREFLNGSGFTEIHTPKIVSTGTEGGAQLFSLDYFGSKAYLAQSPQFYKQIMVGALERVFEIGPVYRAEEHDTTRHLNEYISMDVELGFIETVQDLIQLETELLNYMFTALKEHCSEELEIYGVKLPEIGVIPQISLARACQLLQSNYGWRVDTQEQCLDLDPEGERILCEHFSRTEGSELVFVTEYPWEVRPFYAMSDSSTGLSYSFDLLFRGLEITTGGQRIHEPGQLQHAMMRRGLEPAMFSDYLQCFKYGMPPHGGFAIGLERLAKQLLSLGNVKQASLFARDRNRLRP